MDSTSLIQDTTTTKSNEDDIKLSLNQYWSKLICSIKENNFYKFNEQINDEKCFNKLASLPRFINETIKECQKNEHNCIDFLEILMRQLYLGNYYFECWQETCKSVVRVYIDKHKQFTPYTIYFLLRCYDVNLINLVFEYDLLDDYCEGNCNDWHLMFVASYQERFFAHRFENILEGFLSRFLLLSKLRCSLANKRRFLTWFAGSLHLYCDEYFLNHDEGQFKLVLVKVFEVLILNGLMNNEEYKTLYKMLIKRNQEMMLMSQQSRNFLISATITPTSTRNDSIMMSTNQRMYMRSNSGGGTAAGNEHTNNYIPNVNLFYPLTLKNWSRLTIKRYMKKYTRKYIDKLPLPTNLKRFILFDFECDNAIKCFKLKQSYDDQIIAFNRDSETQTDY